MPKSLVCLEYIDVDGTSDALTQKCVPGHQYYIKGNVDFFVRVTVTGTDAVADTAANLRCTAGVLYPICNLVDTGSTTTNGFIKIISDGVSGDVELYEEQHGRA